jgi:hypothetical protein
MTLQPFSAADIYIYLEQYRDELGIAEASWAPVTDQLEQGYDGVLATALRTPWMLSLAATALHRGGHQTAVELSACRDTAQIRQILLASLIPAAVESTPRTGGTRTYTEENVQRWLSTLARHLEQRRTEHSGGAQIALDQIWHLAGPRRCRVLHVVIGGLIFAAGFTLAVLLSNGGVTPALWVGLVAGIVAMLRFGLAAGPDVGKLSAKRTKRIVWRGRAVTRRFAWRVPGRTRWRRGLKRGLIVGLLLVSAVGVLLGIKFVQRPINSYDYVALSIFGLIVLGFALVSGLASGLGTTPEERLALGQDAQRVIRDDLVSGLMAAILWIAVSLTMSPIMNFVTNVDNAYSHERMCKTLAELGPERLHVYGLDPFWSNDCPWYEASPTTVLKQWPEWLPDGLVIGLIVGGVLAVVFAPLSAVGTGRYGVGSLVFGLTGIFPRRPARFLEWARDSGLLRVTGVAYQFRHDTYHQWLTEGGGNRDVTVRSDPAADARSR